MNINPSISTGEQGISRFHCDRIAEQSEFFIRKVEQELVPFINRILCRLFLFLLEEKSSSCVQRMNMARCRN